MQLIRKWQLMGMQTVRQRLSQWIRVGIFLADGAFMREESKSHCFQTWKYSSS